MNIENQQENSTKTEVALLKEQSTMEKMHTKALSGQSYEDASEALDSVGALQEFREKLRNVPFGSFHEVIEEMTNINRAQFAKEERSERVEHLIGAMDKRASRFSPRVADLFTGILSEINKDPFEPKYEITAEKMNELKQKGDINVLFSANTSWEMKLNRIETRLTDYLSGARALDKREGKEMDSDILKWREEELKKAPAKPAEKRNESKPGVDPMERLKEGERVPTIWSISPAYGGYYKEQSFSKWDNERNTWTEDKYTYSDIETATLCEEENSKKGLINLTLKASVFAEKWVTLPVPYTHQLNRIESGGRTYSAQQDQNGDIVVLINGSEGEEIEISAVLAPYPDKRLTAGNLAKAPDMPSEFSEETNAKLEDIAREKRGNIARASALASYVRRRIKYLAPKDREESERYNSLYNNHPNGFASAVDEIKEADCDVANTYFAALCAKLNIPTRHCVGHSVRGRDELGASSINSGTGHGWSEVWNEARKEWVRVDATPSGDRQLEEEETKQSYEFIPGDYGEQEAVLPTDQDLEKLQKKLVERKEELSYTKEERQLSEHAGVELKEARQIVKDIYEAEKTQLPGGELVVDELSRLFNAIVESRKAVVQVYDGPIRKREGGEAIEDIVQHKIGVLAGDLDPISREKASEETIEEKNIGGFDLYVIGDKSGSMSSTVDGEALWKMQRRAEYLIFSSLHRFEKNLERAGLQKENMLSVRAQGISFRGDGKEDIDLDKPLSTDFSAKDRVKLWHSLTEQGGGNGDPEALGYVLKQIEDEVKKNIKSGAKDDRLRIIIACSDGGYIGDDSSKMQALSEQLHRLKAVVVGIGLTETAAEVPVVMNNPPYSRGDIARDINDLPAIVAKHVVSEAIKLFPEKAKDSAKKIIDNCFNKFKRI